MAFDTLNFVLNYPQDSSDIVTEVSSNSLPASTGMTKVSFHDGTNLGAESGAYVLTKYGLKLVSELTNLDYVGFVTSNTYVGSFRETVQGQQLRYFLVNPHTVFRSVRSVESSQAGYGLPVPIARTEANGGLAGDDYPCICVLFSDSCGTKMNTTTISFDYQEN